MRVYISGPITGVEDYRENFCNAEMKLIDDGFDTINPINIDSAFPNLTYEEYMKIDILLMDMCEAIYLLKGWEKSCGANREYGYALAKDMVIMHER